MVEKVFKLLEAFKSADGFCRIRDDKMRFLHNGTHFSADAFRQRSAGGGIRKIKRDDFWQSTFQTAVDLVRGLMGENQRFQQGVACQTVVSVQTGRQWWFLR